MTVWALENKASSSCVSTTASSFTYFSQLSWKCDYNCSLKVIFYHLFADSLIAKYPTDFQLNFDKWSKKKRICIHKYWVPSGLATDIWSTILSEKGWFTLATILTFPLIVSPTVLKKNIEGKSKLIYNKIHKYEVLSFIIIWKGGKDPWSAPMNHLLIISKYFRSNRIWIDI